MQVPTFTRNAFEGATVDCKKSSSMWSTNFHTKFCMNSINFQDVINIIRMKKVLKVLLCLQGMPLTEMA